MKPISDHKPAYMQGRSVPSQRNMKTQQADVGSMVREELGRLGYAGCRRVPRRVFHTALGFVCHRLLLQGHRAEGSGVRVWSPKGFGCSRVGLGNS